MTRLARDPMSQVEHHRRRSEQIQEFTVKQHRVTHFIDVDGAGEVSVDVNFPVKFIEKPAISSGAAELRDGEVLTAGQFPTANCTVVKWVLDELDETRVYYVGAQLGVVTTGPESQKLTVHVSMEGRALRNPSFGEDETTDGTL